MSVAFKKYVWFKKYIKLMFFISFDMSPYYIKIIDITNTF
jgi:hypothetical protein